MLPPRRTRPQAGTRRHKFSFENRRGACYSFTRKTTPTQRAVTKMKDHEVTHEEARDSRRESRRRFAKSAAAAVVAAPLARALAARAQTPPAKEPAAPPNPQPSPSPQQQQPPSPLALAYAEVARLRFGDKLGEEELVRVRRGIGNKIRTAEALGKFKLQNSDEPDFVFGA